MQGTENFKKPQELYLLQGEQQLTEKSKEIFEDWTPQKDQEMLKVLKKVK